MGTWSFSDIPDQTGRVALVTGANSGIGLETAKALAHNGAHVVLACRNTEKAAEARLLIESSAPTRRRPSIEILPLDLSSLAQVRVAAEEFRSRHGRLDLLVNNAGVMWLPHEFTREGHEMQFGTNHLGHFALTGLLLNLLLKTPASRVVTVSSVAHANGRIHFDDPSFRAQAYGKQKAYGQSKLANLMFALELSRRLAARGASTISVACHPGASSTNLAGPGLSNPSFLSLMNVLGLSLFGQQPSSGALPTLYSATGQVASGDYIGPRYFQLWGAPRKVMCMPHARSADVAGKLWELSEELTGVAYL